MVPVYIDHHRAACPPVPASGTLLGIDSPARLAGLIRAGWRLTVLKRLRWFSLSFALVFLFGVSACAQDTTQPQETTQPPAQLTKQEKKELEKKEKEAKKEKEKQAKEAKKAAEAKKKNDSGPTDAYDTAVFSDRVANNVLGLIRDGLEGHDQRLMESAFDGDQMDGYLSFEDQLESFFNRYVGFRVHIRIIQTSIEGPKGIVTAEFELEGMPRDNTSPVRRSDQLRFVLERGRKGWRIVDFSPRNFFS